MLIKDFKKIKVDDKTTERFQDNVEQAIKPIISVPILDGVLCEDVSLTAGISNEVEHMLGRKPRGYMIVRKQRDTRIWDLQETNDTPTTTLSIACSHDSTVSIWIF